MIAPGLPRNTVLYKLLDKCNPRHNIELVECHDGALIMKCFSCPFHHVLNPVEEEHVRKQMDIADNI